MITKNTLLNIELILSHLPDKDKLRVADLGCGNFGYFVFPLARLVGKKGKVYAVDILKNALEEIRRKARLENLSQVEVVWSDLERLGTTKIETDSLDVALLINTLHQATKSLDMLKEAARMVKPGGELIIVDWDHVPSPLGPDLERRIKKEKLIAALEKIGLEIVKEFKPGDYHYALVFKK